MKINFFSIIYIITNIISNDILMMNERERARAAASKKLFFYFIFLILILFKFSSLEKTTFGQKSLIVIQ